MVEDPFAAFKPSAPEVPAEKAPVEKKKRGPQKGQKYRRKGENAMLEPVQEVMGVIKAPADNGIMVPIGAITACRHLTDDEIKFTIAVAGGISELSKTAQKHVVAALAKIFS